MSSKWIIAALGAEAVSLAVLLTLALDMVAHHRVEHLGGVNVWGYRGAVMSRKRPAEIRVGVVGGNLAFGWGVAASETMPHAVRQLLSVVLNRSGGPPTHVTAVNLGALGLPLRDYAKRIERFADLAPDVICIYVDPGGGVHGGVHLPPPDSAVTAFTGYVPILPLVVEEKGAVLTAHGHRLGTLAVHAGRLLRRVDAAAYGLLVDAPSTAADDIVDLERAIDAALHVARSVVIIMPVPATREQETDIQRAVQRLAGAYAATRRIRIVELGKDRVLHDAALRLDGVNFSVAGHARVAEQVAPVVLDLLRNQPPRSATRSGSLPLINAVSRTALSGREREGAQRQLLGVGPQEH